MLQLQLQRREEEEEEELLKMSILEVSKSPLADDGKNFKKMTTDKSIKDLNATFNNAVIKLSCATATATATATVTAVAANCQNQQDRNLAMLASLPLKELQAIEKKSTFNTKLINGFFIKNADELSAATTTKLTLSTSKLLNNNNNNNNSTNNNNNNNMLTELFLNEASNVKLNIINNIENGTTEHFELIEVIKAAAVAAAATTTPTTTPTSAIVEANENAPNKQKTIATTTRRKKLELEKTKDDDEEVSKTTPAVTTTSALVVVDVDDDDNDNDDDNDKDLSTSTILLQALMRTTDKKPIEKSKTATANNINQKEQQQQQQQQQEEEEEDKEKEKSNNNATTNLIKNKLLQNLTVATLSTLANNAAKTATKKKKKTSTTSVDTTDGTSTTTIAPKRNNNKINGIVSIKHSNRIPSDILDDLASRFVINVPDIEITNLIRVCFQIELAHWFYLDFFCSTISKHQHSQQQQRKRKKLKQQQQQEQQDSEEQKKQAQQQQQQQQPQPQHQSSSNDLSDISNEEEVALDITELSSSDKLQPCGIKYFALQLFEHIPFLRQHSPSVDKILEDWKNYKLSVPTFGAILVSEDLNYCLLVQSYFAKTSWGFPKGKVNENEDPVHCATREVYEETGYDISNIIDPNDYIEAVINYQYTRLYIVRNVSLSTHFEPRTRFEIKCCDWFPIDSLPVNKTDAISKSKLGIKINSFFMITPFVKRLKRWVNDHRAPADATSTTTTSDTATTTTSTSSSASEALTKSSTTTLTTPSLTYIHMMQAAHKLLKATIKTPIITTTPQTKKHKSVADIPTTITTVATLKDNHKSSHDFNNSPSCNNNNNNNNMLIPTGILLNTGRVLKINMNSTKTYNDNNSTQKSSSNNDLRAGRVSTAFTIINKNNPNNNNSNNNNNNSSNDDRQHPKTFYNSNSRNMYNKYDMKKSLTNMDASNCSKSYKINHSQSAIKMQPAIDRVRERQRHKSMGDLDANAACQLQLSTKIPKLIAKPTAATTTTATITTDITNTSSAFNASTKNSSFTPINPITHETETETTTTTATPIAAKNRNVNAKRQLFHSHSVNETDKSAHIRQYEVKMDYKNLSSTQLISKKYSSSERTPAAGSTTPQPYWNNEEGYYAVRSRTRSQGEQQNAKYFHNNNNNNSSNKQHCTNNSNTYYLQKQRSWIIANAQYPNKAHKNHQMHLNKINTPHELKYKPRTCYSERATPVQGLSGCLTMASSSANEQFVLRTPSKPTTPISGSDLLAIASAAAADVVAAATPISSSQNTPLVPCVPTMEGAIAKLHKHGKCITPPVLPISTNVFNEWQLSANNKNNKNYSSASVTSSNSSASSSASAQSNSPLLSLTPSPVGFQEKQRKEQTHRVPDLKHPKPILAGIATTKLHTTAAELEAIVLGAAKKQQEKEQHEQENQLNVVNIEEDLQKLLIDDNDREDNDKENENMDNIVVVKEEENAIGGKMETETETETEKEKETETDAEKYNLQSMEKITINAWTNFTFTKSFMSNLFY